MTLMLRPHADEYTPREPHSRWYASPDGKKFARVGEDLFDLLGGEWADAS